MPTYVVHTIEQTVRIVRVTADTPEDAVHMAAERPDDCTYTEGCGAEVYATDGVLLLDTSSND
jgi:hypothetical protein